MIKTNKQNNKKYIYNKTQAEFYMTNGVMPILIDIHNRTHRTFWVFRFDETKEVYQMWLKKCEEYNATNSKVD